MTTGEMIEIEEARRRSLESREREFRSISDFGILSALHPETPVLQVRSMERGRVVLYSDRSVAVVRADGMARMLSPSEVSDLLEPAE